MDPVSILQLIVHGIMVGSIYVCVSIGLDVIVGVLGMITLAHGEFLMIGMYMAFFFSTALNLPLLLVFVAVPLIFVFLAPPIYYSVFKPIMKRKMATQLFFTASLAVVLSNAAIVFWKSNPRHLANPFVANSIVLGPIFLNQALVLAFIVATVATSALFLFLYKTERGAIIRAMIMNRDLISLIGINPERIYLQGFLLGMLLTGVGAFLLALYYPFTPAVGQNFNLYIWASLILGGVGTIRGCLLGGIIIGITQSLSAYLLPASFQNIVVLILFIIITTIRPTGIFKGRL